MTTIILATGETEVTQDTVTHTEDDATMRAFQQVFDFVNKARNAVIDASNLAKEVASMRTELDGLKTEIQAAHAKNADFEQQLGYVRQERDQALAQAQSWEREYVAHKDKAERLELENHLLEGRRAELQADFNNVVADRDHALMEVRRLQEELDTERSAHAKLKDELAAIYNRFQPQPRNPQGQFQSWDQQQPEPPKVVSSW